MYIYIYTHIKFIHMHDILYIICVRYIDMYYIYMGIFIIYIIHNIV